MARCLTALCGAALIIGAVTAAPVPTHLFPKQSPLYFPTMPGAKWVYVDEDGNIAETVIVSSTERVAGGIEVTVERLEGDKPSKLRKVLVSPAGLFQTEFGDSRLARAWVLLRTPFKPGDVWSDPDEPDLGFQDGTTRIVGTEELKLPAGVFSTIRVESEYSVRGQKMKHSYWYAPDVGLVQKKGNGTRILKSFTPGKG